MDERAESTEGQGADIGREASWSEPTGALTLSAWDDGASVLLVEVAGRRILVDTWIHDTYAAFAPAFFHAVRVQSARDARSLPPIDLILVTSVQEDHCNTATLALLDKRIPVLAEARAARKMRTAGFSRVETLAPGQTRTLFDGQVQVLGLPGYEHSVGFLIRDESSNRRLCIAPHGLVRETLQRRWSRYFQGSWAAAPGEPVIHTLCSGARTTLLKPWGVQSWLLPDRGIILPAPEESALLLELVKPERIILVHGTATHETGWAVRNLVRYPLGADFERTTRELLLARGSGVDVWPSPRPGVKLSA